MTKKQEELDIKYMHLKNDKNKPYATICVIKSLDKTVSDSGVGIAICSESDNFCKKTGRDLAKRRAFKAWHSKKSWLPIINDNNPNTEYFLKTGFKYPVHYRLGGVDCYKEGVKMFKHKCIFRYLGQMYD